MYHIIMSLTYKHILFFSFIVGTLIGSIIVRMFSLKTACRKAAAACVIAHFLACGGALIFMIPSCANTSLAGVSVQYKK